MRVGSAVLSDISLLTTRDLALSGWKSLHLNTLKMAGPTGRAKKIPMLRGVYMEASEPSQ